MRFLLCLRVVNVQAFILFHRIMMVRKKCRSCSIFTADKVLDSIIGVSVPNLSGGYATVMPNHHITKPVLIGEIQSDGQFEIVQQTPQVVGDEWSDYLPDSKDLISDWRKPMECGNFNVATGKCGGKGS